MRSFLAYLWGFYLQGWAACGRVFSRAKRLCLRMWTLYVFGRPKPLAAISRWHSVSLAVGHALVGVFAGVALVTNAYVLFTEARPGWFHTTLTVLGYIGAAGFAVRFLLVPILRPESLSPPQG